MKAIVVIKHLKMSPLMSEFSLISWFSSMRTICNYDIVDWNIRFDDYNQFDSIIMVAIMLVKMQ